MPKVPVDYSNTIIYKIQNTDQEELIYIGHTTNYDNRKNNHKTNSKTTNTDDKTYNYFTLSNDS